MAVKTSKISNYEFLFPKEDVKYINQDNIPVLSFDSEPSVLGGNDPISYTVAIPISRVPDGGSSSARPLGAGGGGGGNPTPGTGSGGGGGGHTESVGNNLSFPVIWSEGSELSLAGTPGEITLSNPYDEKELYLFDADGDGQPETYAYAFAQKTDGNVWQAENVSVPAPDSEGAAPVYVTEVDWGDSLESVDMKVGRPVRVELSLYKALGITYEGEATLPDTMTAFPMAMLDSPSSPDEVQGAGSYTSNGSQPLEYDSAEASVYSAGANLIIQRLEGTREDIADGDLQWNGSQWIDANTDPYDGDVNDPLTGITVGAEVNVGGKIIYGLSKGGWRPTDAGDYRITFYMDPNANAQLDHASIRVSEEEGVAIAAEEGTDVGGTAFVLNGPDPLSGEDRNLTYIDIRVTSGRGSGKGGKGGGKPKLALAEPINLGASELSLSNVAPNEGLNRMPLAAIGAANSLNVPLGS